MRLFRSSGWNLILFFMRYSPGVIMLSVLASIMAGVSSTSLMILINARLSQPLTEGPKNLAAVVGMIVLVLLSTAAAGMLSNHLAHKTSFELRMYICHRMLDTSLRQLEDVGDAKLLAALTQDVPNVVTAFLRVPLLFSNMAIVVGCLVYLGTLSIWMFAALLTFIICSVISHLIPQRKASHFFALARQQQGTCVRHFRALYQGAKELRLNSLRRQAFFRTVLQPTALSEKHYNLRGSNIYVWLNGWSQVLYFVAISLILFVLPGVTQIDLHTLVGYALIMLYMAGPVQGIVNTIPVFTSANISLGKIEELGIPLSPGKLVGFPAATVVVPHSWKTIDASGITHTYFHERDSSTFTLGPIDLTLRPGELVFLIGGNGSGKTTFAKLLSGLYAPATGEIRLDGNPVTDENRDSYRQLFSAIYADFYVFEEFLGIAPSRFDAAANKYLVELQLDQKVQITEGKLSTTNLSYGQQKRLALLVAYLEDRPLYIFDEWAADQDPHFKNIFYHQILPDLKARGKTILVISHDDRYFHIADRLIKFESGKAEAERYSYQTV